MNRGYDETADGEWIKLESWVDYDAVWTADNLETNVCNYGEILILDMILFISLFSSLTLIAPTL
jgi:hypothetical protein